MTHSLGGFFNTPNFFLIKNITFPASLRVFFTPKARTRAQEAVRTGAMCHVIVTCRSMLWTLLSIVVAFAELIAFMGPDWLVSPSSSPSLPSGPVTANGSYRLSSRPHRPTLGLYARCRQVPYHHRDIQCGPYAAHFGEIASGFWQATVIFLAVAILILSVVALFAVFSMCFQSIMRKSIFNVCGLLQGIAGKSLDFIGLYIASCICLAQEGNAVISQHQHVVCYVTTSYLFCLYCDNPRCLRELLGV